MQLFGTANSSTPQAKEEHTHVYEEEKINITPHLFSFFIFFTNKVLNNICFFITFVTVQNPQVFCHEISEVF